MAQSDPPFAMLDENAVRATELRREPYDFAFVDQAMKPSLKEKVLADAQEISR